MGIVWGRLAGKMRNICSFKQPVVPTLMTLALLARSQELGGRKVKFGARVQQAKSLCTDRANCQFGYTFDGQLRENANPGSEGSDFREIIFIPPTASPDTGSRRQENQGVRPEDKFDNQNNFPATQKAPRRRRLRLNIDPRRRTQESRVDTTTELTKVRNTGSRSRVTPVPTTKSLNRKDPVPDRTKQVRNRKGPQPQRSFDLFEPPFPEDENTVTINIGGTPIVIPDFDLSPQNRGQQVSSVITQNRNTKPNTPQLNRQAANSQNQRRNRNQQKAKNGRSQGQRNKQATKQINTTQRPTTQQRSKSPQQHLNQKPSHPEEEINQKNTEISHKIEITPQEDPLQSHRVQNLLKINQWVLTSVLALWKNVLTLVYLWKIFMRTVRVW